MGCSQILTGGTQGLQVDLVLIRLVDRRFNGGVLIFSLWAHKAYRSGQVLIRLFDMRFKWGVLRSSL